MPTNPPLDDIPEEADFLLADRAADRFAESVRSVFLGAVASLRKRAAGERRFALALEYGDPTFAFDAIADLRIDQQLVADLTSARQKAEGDSDLDEAILAGLLLGLAVLKMSLSEEELRDALERARGTVTADLREQAREVARETALAVSLLVLLTLRSPAAGGEGTAGASLADLFRGFIPKGGIGLTQRQVKALVNGAKAALLAKVPPATVRRQMLARAEVYLKQRAEMISRTIAERAINLSQQAMIEAAVARGDLDLATTRRQWVSRADGQVCPRCVAFHLVTALIGEPFVSRTGEVAWVPDVHPAGRCRMRLVGVAA